MMMYGSRGTEETESQREEIASEVALQSGEWAKASFRFHVRLCQYEVSSCLLCVHIYVTFRKKIQHARVEQSSDIWPEIVILGDIWMFCNYL